MSTFLVTGASTGIGRATALRLAGAGFAVLAGIRRDEDGAALRAADGRVEVEERQEPNADARVSGPQSAWIDALGPEGDRSGLEISGDRRLVEALLDEITPESVRSTAAA